MPEPQSGDAPVPITCASFNSGYDYRAAFGNLREVYGGEGGAVYAADRADGLYLIIDESFWAGFAEDLEPLVTIMRFDTAEARDAYCTARFQTFRRSTPKL